MKNLLKTNFFLWGLALSLPVLAIQGDCSWHGGINCSAGVDWSDGSVVCNDGWRDSKDSYYDAEICKDYSSKNPLENFIIKSHEQVQKCLFSTSNNSKLYSDMLSKMQDVLAGYYSLNSCEEIMNLSTQLNLAENIKRLDNDFTYFKTSSLESIEDRNRYVKYLYNNAAKQDIDLDLLENAYNDSLLGLNSCTEMADTAYSNLTTVLYKDFQNFTSFVEQKCNEDDGSIITPIASIDTNKTFLQDANKSQFKSAILNLKDKGIIKGYDDGTFKPFNPINRAEFLKIIIGAIDIEAEGANCFSDVKNEWFAHYVCTAKSKGIINGYPNGSFKPENTINVAEALKIAFNAFKISVSPLKAGEEWFVPYVDYSKQNSLYLNTFNSPSKQITREEMAELISRLLDR